MKSLLALLITATAAAPSPAAAPAAPPCISRADLSAGMIVLAPAVIAALAARCKEALPAQAFLNREGLALAERYRKEAVAPAASILGLVGALAGRKMPVEVDAKTTLALMEIFVKAGVSGIKTSDCAEANEIVDGLSPLPPAKLGQALSGILVLSQRSPKPAREGKAARLSICQDD